jgi:hypothetical protein
VGDTQVVQQRGDLDVTGTQRVALDPQRLAHMGHRLGGVAALLMDQPEVVQAHRDFVVLAAEPGPPQAEGAPDQGLSLIEPALAGEDSPRTAASAAARSELDPRSARA